MPGSTSKTAIIVALVSMLAIACAPRTRELELPVEPPKRFSRADGTFVMPERWWIAFGDPQLNALIDEALYANLDLKTAWERLREARAIVEREGGSLSPEVDAGMEGQLRSPAGEEGPASLWLGLTASYEVDLWGRLRSRVDAARYRARASLADYRTMALSVSAEVASTWFRLLAARSRLELLEDQVEANLDVLRLLESRFGTGQIRSVDILRQRQLIEATRNEMLAALEEQALLEHQLAVLLGRSPNGRFWVPLGALPPVPPLPQAGVPAELVQRRPDVQRDYELLRAADRDLASAIAARYPRLSLSASVGTAQDSTSELFRDWFASLLANLVVPIIDREAREAEVDRSEAVVRQRLYQYGKTAVVALREVEDALAREALQVARIESLEDQSELARKAYQQLGIEYLNGMADYIDVLTALTEEQQLRRRLIAAERVLLELRIALYRALAGGFETARETG
ncbi:MAG: efflux transporter outer membrane subunit [Myxococcota bacterium]